MRSSTPLLQSAKHLENYPNANPLDATQHFYYTISITFGGVVTNS